MSTLGLPGAGRGRNAGFGSIAGFGGPFGANRDPGAAYGSHQPATPEAEAEKAVRTLSEFASAAKAETLWAAGTVDIAGPDQAEANTDSDTDSDTDNDTGNDKGRTKPDDARLAGWLEPLTSTWNRTAIAALLIPALILLIVSLA